MLSLEPYVCAWLSRTSGQIYAMPKCKSSLYTHETHCVTYELCLCNFRLTLVGAGPTGIEEINVHAFLMELTGKVYRSNCDH